MCINEQIVILFFLKKQIVLYVTNHIYIYRLDGYLYYLYLYLHIYIYIYIYIYVKYYIYWICTYIRDIYKYYILYTYILYKYNIYININIYVIYIHTYIHTYMHTYLENVVGTNFALPYICMFTNISELELLDDRT